MVRSGWILLSLFALVWSSGADAAPIQWTVDSGGNGHWYELVTGNPLFWNDARTFAEERGGYLLTVTSPSENAFVSANLISSFGGCACIWIGGFQNTSSPSYSEPAGGWEWVTGEAWSYTNWHPGEPNNANTNFSPAPTEAYLTFWHFAGIGYWNDHSDDTFGTQVIEYDTNPIPEPSTALLLITGLLGLAIRRAHPRS